MTQNTGQRIHDKLQFKTGDVAAAGFRVETGNGYSTYKPYFARRGH